MAGGVVSVVVPTRNEEASLGAVLEELQEAFASGPWNTEVLVVDTRSKDRTVEIAESFGAQVIREDRRGYGLAYLTGFSHASGEFIATLDADFTYPAGAIPEAIGRLEAEHLDFISCERLSQLSPEAMALDHRVGNAVLNLVLRLLHGRRVRDSQSGMWVFRRSLLDRLELRETGMAFSEEIKLEALEKDVRFAELPIAYRPRVGVPKLRAWSDGWRNLRYLLERRLRPAPSPEAAPPSTRA